MKKHVFIINGRGGSGKDTLCDIIAGEYPTRNVTSIQPILDIARYAGWDGVKHMKARKFLSDLKRIVSAFNDLPMRYCEECFFDFLNSADTVLFVHIREPIEIMRFESVIDVLRGDNREVEIHTLLVRRPSTQETVYGNSSDDEVENYAYNIVFDNDCSLEELPNKVLTEFANILV